MRLTLAASVDKNNLDLIDWGWLWRTKWFSYEMCQRWDWQTEATSHIILRYLRSWTAGTAARLRSRFCYYQQSILTYILYLNYDWLTRIVTCSHKHSEILFSEKLWRQWALLHHIRTNLSFMHETVWSVFLRELFWIVTKCYYFWHDAEHCVMIIAAVTGTQQQINLESQWTPPAGATAFKQW